MSYLYSPRNPTPPPSQRSKPDEKTISILTEEVTISVIGSAVCFIAYNSLFIAGQIWAAFGTLAYGIYYIPLFYALFKKHRQVLGYCLIAHAINVLATFGLGIFFFVEIFVPKIITNWLKSTYGGNIEKNGRHSELVNIARYTSIVMCIASMLFFVVHCYAFAFLSVKFRKGYKIGISGSSPSENSSMASLPIPEPIQLPRLSAAVISPEPSQGRPIAMEATAIPRVRQTVVERNLEPPIAIPRAALHQTHYSEATWRL
ncbi:unnamed protein product [Caenorhabditis auriculariae]|uniref:Uncharacterized protein n=1 Tax=Caenorhabditis auriculariae TaxID=2777116 RepID=A0A8S1GPG8_9PELO|nr:unnamed protein product [Caenorhabditis auriculariae]